MVSPTTSKQLTMLLKVILDIISSLEATKVAGDGGQHSPPRLVQPPTVPTGPAVVAQASHEPLSGISASSGSRLVLVVSLATISKPVMTFTDPLMSALVPLTSQVALDDGEEDFVGSEGLATTNNNSDFEGAHLPGPMIKKLVCDLDNSWGKSKDWILQLRDGRQLVLPLSLYRSPDCMLVYSSLEGECVPGNASITNEGQRVSWVDKGEGLVESSSMVPGSRLVLVLSLAMISEPIMTFTDLIVSTLVPLTSQVSLDDRDGDFVGLEGLATTNNDSNFEGAHLPSPTIKKLVCDLDKSWGNSKD